MYLKIIKPPKTTILTTISLVNLDVVFLLRVSSFSKSTGLNRESFFNSSNCLWRRTISFPVASIDNLDALTFLIKSERLAISSPIRRSSGQLAECILLKPVQRLLVDSIRVHSNIKQRTAFSTERVVVYFLSKAFYASTTLFSSSFLA